MSRPGHDLSSNSSEDFYGGTPLAEIEDYSSSDASEDSREISNFEMQLETLFDQCSVAISDGKNLVGLERMKFHQQQKIFNEEIKAK